MVAVTLMWSIAGVVTRHLEHAASFEVTFWRSFFTLLSLLVILPVLEGDVHGIHGGAGAHAGGQCAGHDGRGAAAHGVVRAHFYRPPHRPAHLGRDCRGWAGHWVDVWFADGGPAPGRYAGGAVCAGGSRHQLDGGAAFAAPRPCGGPGACGAGRRGDLGGGYVAAGAAFSGFRA